MNRTLWIPGPTEVAPEIREEMARQMIGHRGSEILLGPCIHPFNRSCSSRVGSQAAISMSCVPGEWSSS